jgi:hypothetical protein
MSDIMERVAVLEAQMEGVQAKEDAILEKLDRIEKEMTRYKGFLGGVAFLGSCIWAAFVLFKDHVMGRS